MARSAIPALNVRWYDGRLVGKVVVPGQTEFAYDEAWLETGHNLSPVSVPFTPDLYQHRSPAFDQLPGFLSDCLPDQWGRRLMARDFQERGVAATPMRMLAWVGSRGLGALWFEPALEEGRSETAWTSVTPLLLAREAQAVMRRGPAESFQHLRRAGTAGGAFPKAVVALMPDGSLLSGGNVAAATRSMSGARLGILKLDSEDDPLRPSTDGRMEQAYLAMARAAGIRSVRSEVLAEVGGERPRHHLFVERFDVVSGGSRRLHLLTLAGALHTFDLTYNNLLLTTRQITQDHTEVLEATRRMIFNVRGGNADDHGKNHCFVFDDTNGRWSLSPAYDLTLNYSVDRSFSGLFPSTFGTSPRRSALADVASGAGVTLAEFDRLDVEVAAAIERWGEFAEVAGVPNDIARRARSLHEQLASSLALGATAAPRKRRKRW